MSLDFNGAWDAGLDRDIEAFWDELPACERCGQDLRGVYEKEMGFCSLCMTFLRSEVEE